MSSPSPARSAEQKVAAGHNISSQSSSAGSLPAAGLLSGAMASIEMGVALFCQLVDVVPRALAQIPAGKRAGANYTPPAWVQHASTSGAYAGPYTVERIDPLGVYRSVQPWDGYGSEFADPTDLSARLTRARDLVEEHGTLEAFVEACPLAFIDLVLSGQTGIFEVRYATMSRSPSGSSVPDRERRDVERLSHLLDGAGDWTISGPPEIQDNSPLTEIGQVLARLAECTARSEDLRTWAAHAMQARMSTQRMVGLVTLAHLYFTLQAGNAIAYSERELSQLRHTSLSAFRFLRNVVPHGGAQMQLCVLRFVLLVPERKELLRLTSGAIVENTEEVPLARTFVQVLANCTTRCPRAQEQFWRLIFPDFSLDNSGFGDGKPATTPNLTNGVSRLGPWFLQRLAEMDDQMVAMAMRVLLLNCVRENEPRATHLATGEYAFPVMRILLHGLHRTHESILTSEEETETDGRTADTGASEGRLQLDHAILCSLFRCGLLGPILSWLALSQEPEKQGDMYGMGRTTDLDGQKTTSLLSPPAVQLTTELVALLKSFDAYLDAGAEGYHTRRSCLPPAGKSYLSLWTESAGEQGHRRRLHDAPALWAAWTGLSNRMISILRDASLSTSSQEDKTEIAEQKGEVVALHQCLILLLQILSSLILFNQRSVQEQGKEQEQEQEQGYETYNAGHWLVEQFSSPSSVTGGGSVEGLVALLQATEKIAPAVSPFPVRDGGDKGLSSDPLPEGHVLSHTGSSRRNGDGAGGAKAIPHRVPFLKRDVLRMVSALTFLAPRPTAGEARRVRDVQDRIRSDGGLWTILTLTQLDEANPYIREHAILALAFLLKHNLPAQQAVSQLQLAPAPQHTADGVAVSSDRARVLDQARQWALERAQAE